MLEQVERFIRSTGMIAPGDHVIVSVSGGPDSVALLHLLHRLAGPMALRLHVFHMEHGLRGEASIGDARYVVELAERLGLPHTVVTVPPGMLHECAGSLQANARSLRYREIATLAAQIGATRVALGHNRDDQAETVLMRFLRGTGPRGLSGIPPIRAAGGITFVRPLLEISRREIEAYCKKNELNTRLDASNLKPDYLRNRIRLELLPHLAETYNPAIAGNLAQTADLLRTEDQFMDRLAAEALQRCQVEESGEVALAGALLAKEPLALARRVVRLAARMVAGPEYDLGLEPVTRVLAAAADSRGTHRLDLPGGVQVTVEYGICRFRRSVEAPVASSAEWPVSLTGETPVPELGLCLLARTGGRWESGPLSAAFDRDRLPGPLSIRFRRPGDRIWPAGMAGCKKLQDILVDAKVPKGQRDQIPILVSGSELLWVIGYRLDRRFLATPTTDPTLHLKVTALEANR